MPKLNPFKRRGRPPRPMPDDIPDTPENVMRSILTTSPKKKGEWTYETEAEEE